MTSKQTKDISGSPWRSPPASTETQFSTTFQVRLLNCGRPASRQFHLVPCGCQNIAVDFSEANTVRNHKHRLDLPSCSTRQFRKQLLRRIMCCQLTRGTSEIKQNIYLVENGFSLESSGQRPCAFAWIRALPQWPPTVCQSLLPHLLATPLLCAPR
jgi:hypothetical protein